jgi:Heterokaryon incompatibility protein (HET)
MFSHRWQPSEPSFQMVENALIYELPISPTIDKLVNFCSLVQSRRFRWAWSDTCCVDQSDKRVQQDSVIAMFQWYCRAALTIVHLVGVFSDTQEPGSLRKSSGTRAGGHTGNMSLRGSSSFIQRIGSRTSVWRYTSQGIAYHPLRDGTGNQLC